MSEKTERELLARVANLELALHSMWSMLSRLQPYDTQISIDEMMRQHFEVARSFNAMHTGDFISAAAIGQAREQDGKGE